MQRRSILLGALAGFFAPFLPRPKPAQAEERRDIGGILHTCAVPLRQELTSDMFVFEAAYALHHVNSRARADRTIDAGRFGINRVIAVVIEPTLCPSLGNHLESTRVEWSAEQFMSNPIGHVRDYYATYAQPHIDPTRYRAVEFFVPFDKDAPDRSISFVGSVPGCVGYWHPSPFHNKESGERALAWRTDEQQAIT